MVKDDMVKKADTDGFSGSFELSDNLSILIAWC